MTHELPTGAVTLLFTDIEGSTRLLDALGDRFGDLMVEHRRQLRDAVAVHGGLEVGTRGDGHCAVFTDPAAAVRAAVDVQLAVTAASWPDDVVVRVRMGVHTGGVGIAGDEYYGMGLHAASRVGDAAHGGQIVVSEETQRLTSDVFAFVDLGHHVLKDLGPPRRLYQVVHEGLDESFPPPSTLSVLPNNLPATMTSFVGRETETEEIGHLLDERRLVTIRGPGGIGKTRTALQVAAASSDGFDQGVWFVDLAALAPADAVVGAVARALNVRDLSDRPLREAVEERLRWQQLLLVVDNCEHVVDDCADVIASILRNCPRVVVLATSREALQVPGEVVYDIGPLDLEGDEGSQAVRLFVQRASAAVPGWTARHEDVRAIAGLCERLDGLPLAIELAAARTSVLTVNQIAERVAAPRFLSGGRGVPERQRSLDALIEWSHQLLAPHDRAVFRRLAVFRGGFTLDAAEGVCATEGTDVVDSLSKLVEASLVFTTRDDAAIRYAVLETIRTFALERLAEAGEMERVRERHRDAYASLVVRAQNELDGAEQSAWLDRLDIEFANIADAVGWSLENREPEEAARIVLPVRRFWLERGHLRPAAAWLRRLTAELPEDSYEFPDVLSARGMIESVLGEPAAAADHLERARTIALQRGDDRILTRALSNLGVVRERAGDLDAAEELYTQVRDIARRIGDKDSEGAAIANLGNVALTRGDLDRAEQLHGEALDIVTAAGAVRIMGNIWNSLGLVSWIRGDLGSASERIGKAVDVIRRIGSAGLALALGNLAGVARELGDLDRALAMQSQAVEIAERSGDAESLASGLVSLGTIRFDLGQRDAAFAGWSRGLEVARAAGMANSTMGALFNLALYSVEIDDLSLALEQAEELLAIARESGATRREGDAMNVLADIALRRGDHDDAERFARDAIRILEEIGSPGAVAHALGTIAQCAAEQGRHAEALELLGDAEQRADDDEPLVKVELLETRGRVLARGTAAADVERAIERLLELAADAPVWLRARCIEGAAEIRRAQGDESGADRLRDEAATLRADR